MGMASHNITPSDSLSKFLLPVHMTLSSAGLSSKGKSGSTRRHNNNIKLEVKTFIQLLSCPNSSESTGKEVVILLVGVICLD